MSSSPSPTGTEMTTHAHLFPQSSERERPVYILFKLEKKSNVTVAEYTRLVPKVSCLYLFLWYLAEHRAKNCLTEQNI